MEGWGPGEGGALPTEESFYQFAKETSKWGFSVMCMLDVCLCFVFVQVALTIWIKRPKKKNHHKKEMKHMELSKY